MRFDPRTKLLLLLEVNVLLFADRSLAFESSLVLFCLMVLVLDGQKKSALKWAALYALLLVAAFTVGSFKAVYLATLVDFAALCVRKVLPCVIIGLWVVRSTRVGEFYAAMLAWRLPRQAIIPLTVVFRYFPTVREEWESIRSAMRMRGITAVAPLKMVEYAYVPLLFSASSIADELSAAALSRGIDNPCRHTSLTKIGFKAADAVILAVTPAIALMFVVVKSMV
jgi:energy-coupling factor transport system permease protein